MTKSKLTLADYFDVHLDRAPKEGAELALGEIVLVARSISGRRVSVVGLRLPEDEETPAPLTRRQELRRKLADLGRRSRGFRCRATRIEFGRDGPRAFLTAAPSPRRTTSRALLQHHDLRRELAQLGDVVADIDHGMLASSRSRTR